MVLGAQLFTVRELAKTPEQIDTVLKKIAEIGYTTVQVSGIGPIEPAKLRGICDRCGLRIVITHSSADRMLEDPEAVVKDHEILGCNLIGLGSLGKYAYTEDGIRQFIRDFTPVAKTYARHGMRLMYHNHNMEFDRIGGKLIFDLLADAFDSELLGFTLDTYWVQAGGADPTEWLEKLSGRVPAIHLKDMAFHNEPKGQVMAPVGHGNMNWKRILPAAEKAGAQWALVEQDTCEEDPLICLQKSFEFLRSQNLR